MFYSPWAHPLASHFIILGPCAISGHLSFWGHLGPSAFCEGLSNWVLR
jgi:hypothetical protein